MKYFSIIFLLASLALGAQDPVKQMNEQTFAGLELRNIGPAFTSGRIADIAIHPEDPSIWYVAVGSGGVWKTVNSGVTWSPIFDSQASYSTGCVSIDPGNTHVIWVGTGEDVGGRHVGFGDGIYRSNDEGKSWTNMGLKESEHIARIIVHPQNSDVIFVAAQGPLWSKGGERGLYKSTDGGLTWKEMIGVDEWTGVGDVLMDPENPSVLYAATWQRHRNVAVYMGGGPGSAIYKSSDCGESWKKLSKGLPSSRLGKIGLAISPFDHNVVYAAIELDRRKGGLYMSADGGNSWKKQSDAVSGGTGPHYYQELFASPHSDGTLFLCDAVMQISDDHGKSFRKMNEDKAHVDNHAVAFRPDDSDYVLIGTDGGLYESFDNTKNWRFIANLPVTQYYKLAVDDSEPFYTIYGGTQDNGSHGGPSRTDNRHGIRNSDWFKILGADGHQVATEPGNPDIVYGEYQQGVMFRVDRLTGEQVLIQPQAGEGEPFERFNWDTPILVSPHNPARIYTASYRVWKSENRGDEWEAVSPDLTKNQERLALPVMGGVQSWDNPWDVYAMSTYNTITSLAESPLQEGLLYAGTDDGIIQVSENGGERWRKLELGSIKEIPESAFVNDIRADLFDSNTVYAAVDNHKFGDYKPYLLKSTDRGKSWKLINGDLPERLLVWRMVQDHVNKDLLFTATEFGIYFTVNGGENWIKLKGKVPTISFRDLTIQRRENDLVAASFGRGFFVLDDISPLRSVSEGALAGEAILFPVKDTWCYRPRHLVDGQGANEFSSANPPFGAVFTYYLKEGKSSLKSERKKREKKITEEGGELSFPAWEDLDKELREEEAFLLFTIKDVGGELVNHVKAPVKKGLNRVSWDLRRRSARSISVSSAPEKPATSSSYMVQPGEYSVSMKLVDGGEVRELSPGTTFSVRALRQGALEGSSPEEIEEYRLEYERAQKSYQLVTSFVSRTEKELTAMKSAVLRMEKEDPSLVKQVHEAGLKFNELKDLIHGSPSRAQVGEKLNPGPGTRLDNAGRALSSSYGPTATHRASLELVKKEIKGLEEKSGQLRDTVMPELRKALLKAGAPEIEFR